MLKQRQDSQQHNRDPQRHRFERGEDCDDQRKQRKDDGEGNHDLPPGHQRVAMDEVPQVPKHRLPYVHGWADQLAGKGFLDNHYDSYTDDGRVWIDGYVACLIAMRQPFKRFDEHKLKA